MLCLSMTCPTTACRARTRQVCGLPGPHFQSLAASLEFCLAPTTSWQDSNILQSALEALAGLFKYHFHCQQHGTQGLSHHILPPAAPQPGQAAAAPGAGASVTSRFTEVLLVSDPRSQAT